MNHFFEEIGNLLIKNNLTLSSAESCTAGGISSKLCSIAGSSKYFLGAIVAYSNQSKIRDLGVLSSDIIKYSEVSFQVSKQMSELVKKKFNTDFAISTTGYTGPSGMDVGKVFISVSTPKKNIVSEFKFKGNRLEITQQIIDKSLRILLDEINVFIYNDI